MDILFTYFTELDLCIAAVLMVLFAYQVYFYVRYIAAPARRNRRVSQQPLPEPEQWPGVSVIVAARNEQTNLNNYLQALLEQDYPKFEVIVVNDGSEDNTQMVLEEYHQKYPNMHITFVPLEARVTSSKKLALTLAIKAAIYDYLLLTDADCVPESNHWIAEMTRGLSASPNTQIVLGYSPYFPESSAVNRIIRYETLFNGLHYMGRALAGHPYMGVGRNMLYSKALFMDHKGFAGLLSLRSGDDDLFVNKVALRDNTNVVCSPNSLVWSLPKTTFREWIMQKRRHLSASPYYKPATRLMLGFENVMRGLWYLMLIVALVWGGLALKLVAAAFLLLRLVMQLALINRSARQWGEKPFGIEIVWYDICLPLLTAFLLSTQPNNQNNRW
ncbi:MAG: glycosyltransferase [Paludibacteraceae bacterium]|nr:glycosyltransferase [Paludibacteraceae bacterium]